MVRDRPGVFSRNGVPGTLQEEPGRLALSGWEGAWSRHHTYWADPVGIRFRDERTKRQLFRLNLPPSRLLGTGAGPKLKQIIESPDGRAGPDRGLSPLVSIHFGGMVPVNRDGRKVTS